MSYATGILLREAAARSCENTLSCVEVEVPIFSFGMNYKNHTVWEIFKLFVYATLQG